MQIQYYYFIKLTLNSFHLVTRGAIYIIVFQGLAQKYKKKTTLCLNNKVMKVNGVYFV